MLCMPLRHSRDCERWHTALNIGRPFESNAPVPEWKFVVFRTDGAIAFFHTNLGTTEVSDPQVIQFNNMRRGGGDGSPRTPLTLRPAPPLTPRSSVDADDDDIETSPPHHPAPSQPDTQDAPQDAPQLLPPPPLSPPPCLGPPPPLPDEVEPRDNRLSAKDYETADPSISYVKDQTTPTNARVAVLIQLPYKASTLNAEISGSKTRMRARMRVCTDCDSGANCR